MPHRIVTKAINWVDTLEKDDNFFLYVAFPEPHNPYQVPEPYFSMFSEDKIPPIETSAEDLKNKGFKWKFSRNGPTS